MEKKTRRTFLYLINAGIVVLFLFFWNRITSLHIKLSGRQTVTLPFNKNKPVSFYDNFIIISEKEKLSILSSHCTHLGCRISKFENGKLICPCHGSEYDLDGNPLKGPAYKPLVKMPATISDDGQTIQITN